MKKLTEVEKLKYWLDSELSILHIMFAILLYNMLPETWQHILIIIYIALQALYGLTRLGYLFAHDPDYLKVPKK